MRTLIESFQIHEDQNEMDISLKLRKEFWAIVIKKKKRKKEKQLLTYKWP